MSFYFYPTTSDEVIKINKSFSNNKSGGPDSLPTSILNNCVDVLSFPISYLVNLFFTTGKFPNLCKIEKPIHYFKKVISLIILIIDLYLYSPHSGKYLKNVFTSVF